MSCAAKRACHMTPIAIISMEKIEQTIDLIAIRNQRYIQTKNASQQCCNLYICHKKKHNPMQ